MKHKVGDKVRVKSLDWYNTNKNKIGDVPLKSQCFVKNMSKFCGIFVTIKRVAQSYYLIEEDDFGWHFTDEMFEEGIYFSELYCDKTQKIIWTEFAPDTIELVIGKNYELIINDGVYKVIKKKPYKEETMGEFNIKTQDLIKKESSSENLQNNLFSTTMQGWQCPVCKRVYSPFTSMCLCCGGKETTTTTLSYTSTD